MPAYYAKSEKRLRWNLMRKTQIKTCQFQCGGKMLVYLARQQSERWAHWFLHKLEENKSFSWPSFVLVHTNEQQRSGHLSPGYCHWFSMRMQQYVSQQVWLFPSRVAWSPPETLPAGVWGLSMDPFPDTAFIQTHAWVLLLYEDCAKTTWFLGYFSVITLQTFRIT